LVARSAVGGILLTGAAQFVLYLLLVLFVTTIDRMKPVPTGSIRFSHQPEVHTVLLCFVVGIGLSYAAMMLCLGHRKFAKLEPAALWGPV
jgi:hypothetical protein